ncbi:MAG: discoidin domain-containing protein [Phycisphaeraceae bacterium]
MKNRMMKLAFALGLTGAMAAPALALDNHGGGAETPPMGVNPFNSHQGRLWNQQRWLLTAEAVARNGMKEAGYIYINNDCGTWASETSPEGHTVGLRNENDRIIVHEFIPDGLPYVGDYIHDLDLKIGYYVMPAIIEQTAERGTIEKDFQAFADWGADFIKWDAWMDSEEEDFVRAAEVIESLDRPIVFSVHGRHGPAFGHMWRTGADIDGEWRYILSSINPLAGGAGQPGGWPDPDMLEVGHLDNMDEEQSHFSLWCVSSSPLLAGNDVRSMFHDVQSVLLNTEAIAVNQDISFAEMADNPFGSGKRVRYTDNMQLWVKPLEGNVRAVLLVNTGESDQELSVSWSEAGLPEGEAQVRDLWAHENLGGFTNRYAAQVPPHGCKFLKIVPGSEPMAEPEPTWFPAPEAPTPIQPLARDGWSIETNLGNGQEYIDGDASTPAMVSGGQNPNVLTIDMQESQTFNTVLLNSRYTGELNALRPYTVYASAHEMEVHVSEDGESWKQVYDGFIGPNNYGAFTFEDQTARYVRIVHALSEGTQGGPGSDLDYQPFGPGEGQVTEIKVAQVEELPEAFEPGAGPDTDVVHPPLD